MDSDGEDGWIRHRFAPGEGPTVYTWDLCAEAGSHEQCKQIESHKGKALFCTCFCHKVYKGDPN
jgi:hypothetical protein